MKVIQNYCIKYGRLRDTTYRFTNSRCEAQWKAPGLRPLGSARLFLTPCRAEAG